MQVNSFDPRLIDRIDSEHGFETNRDLRSGVLYFLKVYELCVV